MANKLHSVNLHLQFFVFLIFSWQNWYSLFLFSLEKYIFPAVFNCLFLHFWYSFSLCNLFLDTFGLRLIWLVSHSYDSPKIKSCTKTLSTLFKFTVTISGKAVQAASAKYVLSPAYWVFLNKEKTEELYKLWHVILKCSVMSIFNSSVDFSSSVSNSALWIFDKYIMLWNINFLCS